MRPAAPAAPVESPADFSPADFGLAESLLRRVRQDGATLDETREQALDAVEAPNGARILHGLVEEAVDRFRESSLIVMEGVKGMAAQVGRERAENGRLRQTCATLEANGNSLAENMELNIKATAELEGELEAALEELTTAKAYIDKLQRDKLQRELAEKKGGGGAREAQEAGGGGGAEAGGAVEAVVAA